MKKTFKIFGAVLAVLLALLIVLPFALRGKIGDIVKTEANKMLNARLDFESLDVSLIRRFPKASLELRGLTLTGIDKFEGDTIVAADRISVAVDVMSLFGDDGFEVSKVLLVRPSVYGHKLADGSVSWDVMKPSDDDDDDDDDDDSPSTFRLSLKAFDVKEAQLRYADDSTRMYAATMPLDLSLKGDMSADETDLKLKLTAGGLTYRSEGTTLLSGARAELVAEVEADLENNRYTLSDNTLRLNNIALSLDGWVELDDDAVKMDLRANTSRVEFRDILSMIPAFYTRDFKDLTAGGSMTLAAWVRGEMKGERLPAFNLALKVADGSFKYASLPQGVTGINIDAAVANPGGTADATTADVSKFTATFAGNTLAATLRVATPVSDLDFAASAEGKVDLGAVKDVYPLGDSIRLDGRLTVDLKAAARMSDIEKERYEKINAEGSFVLEDMEAEVTGLPAVKIRRAAASVTPQAMTLSELSVNVGRSDLSAHGRLTDYMAYALRDETLHGSLTVTSNLVDLNEIMGYVPEEDEFSETAEQTAAADDESAALAVPKNLDLSLATTIKEMEFQKMEIADFTGALRVRDGILSVDRLTMKAFGGTVTAAPASYDTSDPEAPKMKFNCSIANASFAETFRQLDVVKKIVPLFEKTGGDYSMKLDMTSDLTADLSPVYKSIQASGEISSQNIHLNNVVAFDKLAEALKNDKLKKIEARDVKIAFTVKDGRLNTKPFDIKMGNIALNLSGSTGLDQTIDYAGKVSLPDGLTGGVLSNVDLKIGGTFTSPKVSVDVKEAAKEAVTNVVNEQLKKLTGSENLNEEFERQAEKLRSEAAKAGEKLVDEAKKQREALVNKASNALTRLAAEKSGDALVKEAEKQSAKLQAEAEKQIEALREKMNAQQ